MTLSQNQAKDAIAGLIKKYRALSDTDRQTATEAGVVHQFIQPMLEALGWPVDDPHRFKYELSTQAGRPDMTLLPDRGGTLFVEAKRFGIIAELEAARKTIRGIITPGQLALPGMAGDRTKEEQQAINYAFENGGTWAILTNFEKLRLFNARRDWLVLSFENPQIYLDEFDQLWQLSYDSILSGQLDLLSNQRHREDVDTDYLNFINTWRERLAQDLIARPAANPWAFTAEETVDVVALRRVVQRVLDRLVVVRFAEDHLIAPAGTLFSLFEICKRNPYTFSLGDFFRQLYRRFDELHNSALFAPDLADQAVFSDDVLGDLVQKLYEARYRAMSADIMGNTYEQYLGKTLARVNGSVRTADNLETRKKQGSYYTPQVIVRYLVDNSLGRYLYGTPDGKPPTTPTPDPSPESREGSQGSPPSPPAGGTVQSSPPAGGSGGPNPAGGSGGPNPAEGSGEPTHPKTVDDIRDLRCLDPACGSGSFLIYAYQVLADFYRREIERLTAERDEAIRRMIDEGLLPIEAEAKIGIYNARLNRLQNYPRLILERHLYGVDLDPQAAEIATVNLIMRAIADQPSRDRYLPLILNQNVKVGNALIGARPDDPRLADHAAALAGLHRRRRELLTLPHGPQRDALLRETLDSTARLNASLAAPLTDQFADPATQRPFNWAVEFPEVFVDEQGHALGQAAGFDIIIGNPPWEIVKPDLREYYAQFDDQIESKLTRKKAERRIKELNAEDPDLESGWQAQKARIEATAAYYKSSPDFTRQGRGDTATHKLFLERAYDLLRDEGRLGFVVPSGIYSDLGTKELREMMLNEGRIEYLYNFSNERFFFPDVDHRFQFTLLGVQKGQQSEGFWTAFRFDPRVAIRPEELPAFLANPANLVYVQRAALHRFSPDSLSLMEFKVQQDYDVTEKLYGNWPLLGEKLETIWNVRLNREFDMTNDRHLFNQVGGPVAIYNGRMLHQFDAHFAPHEFWIAEESVNDIKTNTASQMQHYRVGYRRIARSTDTRTLIAAVIPPQTICDTVAVIEDNEESQDFCSLFLSGIFNSLCLDYLLRQKIATTVNMFYMYQLPLPRLTSGNPYFEAIVPRAARLTCTTPAFADLWQAVMKEPWPNPPSPQGRGAGGEGPPATDPAERQSLRDELDALVAHLYGLTADDFAHILDTFPLVFPPDDEGQAKKERLLGVYERFGAVVAGWERGRP